MKQRKKYSDEFKTKVILECLREEMTINELGAKHEVHPVSIKDWKRQFLENAVVAFNPDKTVKKYKEKVREKDREVDNLHRQLGKLTTQLDWAKKKI